MISLIHHSGRVKSVMVFIFGCHVVRVLNKVERPRQTPWAYKLSKPEKKNIQISLSYSKIVRSHFLRQRKSPFVHQMFPFLLKNAPLWKSYGMNTVHVCSTWMLQTVDKDCWFVAFFVLTWYLTCCFFSPGCPSGTTSYGKSNDGFNAFWGDVLFFYFFLTYRLLSVLYGNLFFIAV